VVSIANNNEIVVVGELNVDLIASGLRTEPTLGSEIIAGDFEITLGSASAIFACGIANLDRGVKFVSRVGADAFGEFCIDALEKRGISTDNVRVTDVSKTGVTIVMSTPEDRAMVTYLGAIAELGIDDIPSDVFDGSNHLHLTSYYLQTVLQPHFSRLMASAKEKGLTTSFDPNSDPEQSSIEKISAVLKYTDIFFINEQEARLLTGQDNVRSACLELGQFCPLVVVKLGAKGAIAYRDGEFVEVGGFKVDALDTTGAGDSFAAGFVHAFLDGKDLRECLTVGNACGALSTTKPGGTNGQPNVKELNEFLHEIATR